MSLEQRMYIKERMKQTGGNMQITRIIKTGNPNINIIGMPNKPIVPIILPPPIEIKLPPPVIIRPSINGTNNQADCK